MHLTCQCSCQVLLKAVSVCPYHIPQKSHILHGEALQASRHTQLQECLKKISTRCCGWLQGLAPFGADLAVLVYNTALEGASPRPPSSLAKTAAMSGVSASEAIEASTELQHERPELKILTWAHEEVAADALSITGGLAVPWTLSEESSGCACACVRACTCRTVRIMLQPACLLASPCISAVCCTKQMIAVGLSSCAFFTAMHVLLLVSLLQQPCAVTTTSPSLYNHHHQPSLS